MCIGTSMHRDRQVKAQKSAVLAGAPVEAEAGAEAKVYPGPFFSNIFFII